MHRTGIGAYRDAGLIHGDISYANVMTISLPPEEPPRFGLRPKGLLLDLDPAHRYVVRDPKGSQKGTEKETGEGIEEANSSR